MVRAVVVCVPVACMAVACCMAMARTIIACVACVACVVGVVGVVGVVMVVAGAFLTRMPMTRVLAMTCMIAMISLARTHRLRTRGIGIGLIRAIEPHRRVIVVALFSGTVRVRRCIHQGSRGSSLTGSATCSSMPASIALIWRSAAR